MNINTGFSMYRIAVCIESTSRLPLQLKVPFLLHSARCAQKEQSL